MFNINRLYRSSTLRLSLLASILIWVASSAVAIVIHHFTLIALVDEASRQLQHQEEIILKGIEDLAAEAEPSRWLYRRLSGQIAQALYCIRLTDSENEVLISNSRPEKKPIFQNKDLFTIERIDDGNNRFSHCLSRKTVLQDGGIFYFGIPFENTLHLIDQMDNFRFWGLFTSALLSLLIGITISLRGLKGLQTINRACAHVTQGDLSHRIPISKSRDDFDRLAQTINTMLDKISMLMSGVSQVSDSIAHDLRTPLARMRNQIELMQRKQSSDELTLLMSQLDHILNAFNALLRISQLEQGSLRQAFTHFDFKDVVTSALNLYEIVFEDKSIKFDALITDETFPCFGDKELWIQTLSNLLDNAYKYTPQNGQVSLTLNKEHKKIILIVCDSGPGIPSTEHSNVFTRFYRLERHRSQSGTGLGLSLVRAVCQVHNATIQLSNNSESDSGTGLNVKISIPMDVMTKQHPALQQDNPQAIAAIDPKDDLQQHYQT